MPLAVVTVAPTAVLIPIVGSASLVFLALLGALAARAGGSGGLVSVARVTSWGALAMALTTVVGRFFGTVV